jgi:disulfide bond formation protein DsbB
MKFLNIVFMFIGFFIILLIIHIPGKIAIIVVLIAFIGSMLSIYRVQETNVYSPSDIENHKEKTKNKKPTSEL